MKPMHYLARIRRPLLIGAAVALAAALLGSGTLICTAQDPNGGGTNDVNAAAEVISRLGDLIQAVTGAQPEDITAMDAAAAIPGGGKSDVAPSGGERPNRFSRQDAASRPDSSNRPDNSSRAPGDSRSRSRRSRSSQPGQSRSSSSSRDYSSGGTSLDASGRTTNGPMSLDYASFKRIVDLNIFDPNRFPRSGPRPAPTRIPNHVDSLTLVGTMSYEKGSFAFFDGSSADYKKALKQSDAIVGYKVKAITPTSVTLASGTNQLNLGVGMQLRREEDGPWHVSGQSATYAAISSSSSTSTNAAGVAGSDASSGGADSDVVKKLMQRRQQE
jgi:hypothetical protein